MEKIIIKTKTNLSAKVSCFLCHSVNGSVQSITPILPSRLMKKELGSSMVQ